MRFSVPQFIEVEDKIIGPLTLKQAIYLTGAVGFAIVAFIYFGFFIAILIGGPLIFLAFLLSFVKVQGRPFINVLSSAFFYTLKSKLYLWEKTTPKKKKAQTEEEISEKATRPTSVNVTQSNLKRLAWTLDTSNPFEKDKK
jgi:hypothetical protein